MLRSLQIASTGMAAQELNVEVISNNIANLNTNGYKRRIAEFQDLLYQAVNRDIGTQSTTGGNIPPVGNLVGLGVKNAGIFQNNGQGTPVQTNNDYDLAIQGRGFFQVTDSNGTIYYTRDGRFNPNQDGLLVNSQGYTLDPGITIPNNIQSVDINQDGEVIATNPDNTTTNLGRITLVNFLNESGLRPLGNNLYEQTEASGDPQTSNPGEDGYGTILKGYVEGSNVDAVIEITSLITAQRAYELNSRVISTADDMLDAINNIR